MPTLFEHYGDTAVRPRGKLVISPWRDLTVAHGHRAAYDANGYVVEESIRRWAPHQDPPDNAPSELDCVGLAETVDEHVIWGGSLQTHYGHFLTESTARLWSVLPGAECSGASVVFAAGAGELPFVKAWLTAFGVPTIMPPRHRVLRFPRMAIPEPAWRLNAWVTPEARDIHLHARQGMNVVSQQNPIDVLWLSRSSLNQDRTAQDEVLLEWLLSDYITSVSLETASLAEQVAVIEASRAVVGQIGSAFHTLLLSREVPDWLCFCPRRFQSAYLAQAAIVEAKAEFVHAHALLRMGRFREGGFPRGYRWLIPEALRALDNTVLPGFLEHDSVLSALARPECLSSRSGDLASEDEIYVAIARVLLDPLAFWVRMRLGAIFEARELYRCALEQYRVVAELTNDYPRAPIGAARVLHRLGRPNDASAMARRALMVDPTATEALRYLQAEADCY